MPLKDLYIVLFIFFFVLFHRPNKMSLLLWSRSKLDPAPVDVAGSGLQIKIVFYLNLNRYKIQF